MEHEKIINLEDLRETLPDRTGVGSYGAVWRDCASLRLERHGHPSGSKIAITGDEDSTLSVVWSANEHQLEEAYRNENKTTEMAATGIALLVVEKFLGLTFKEELRVDGQGVDYLLWPIGSLESLKALSPKERLSMSFKSLARLEVTGISKGTESIASRSKKKVDRLGTKNFDAQVCVIDFKPPEFNRRKV